MKRTSVFLDELLTQKANRYARKQGTSFASVVREALAAFLANPEEGKHMLPSIAGRYKSAESDTAERSEELLWEDPHA